MADRIVVVHGAPFIGLPSPLDTYVMPLLAPLGIDTRVVERDDPIDASVFSATERVYMISHSHGTNWSLIVIGHIVPWWPATNKLGWTSIDGVRFTLDDATNVANPRYDPQTKNVPFVVPSIVNICRAYHRKLPIDRNTAAGNLPLAVLNFPFSSLVQGSSPGQDVTDTEVSGTVGSVITTFTAAGVASAAITAALGSQIDHNTLVAAVAGKVIADVKQFFGIPA